MCCCERPTRVSWILTLRHWVADLSPNPPVAETGCPGGCPLLVDAFDARDKSRGGGRGKRP